MRPASHRQPRARGLDPAPPVIHLRQRPRTLLPVVLPRVGGEGVAVAEPLYPHPRGFGRLVARPLPGRHPTLLRRDAPTLVGEPSPRQDSSSSIGSLPPTPTEEAPPPGTTTTTTSTMKANAPTAGAKPQQPYDPERRTPDSILDVAQLS